LILKSYLKVKPTHSDFRIEENEIGLWSSNYDSILSSLGQPEDIKLDYAPNQVVELKDKNILISSYENKHLALHDPDFKLIRKIDKISGKLIQPYGLDVSSDGHIFMTNTIDTSIYKLNSEFELVQVYKGANDEEYKNICIYKDKLYAAVGVGIDVMSLDLELISSHDLRPKGWPFRIKIADDRACVLLETDEPNKRHTAVCFYSLPKFDLITSIDYSGPMLVHHGMFYIYYDSCFYAYDQDGELVDLKATVYRQPEYADDGMSLIRNQLFICLPDGLCKLSFN
jgi:hypothetical protein